MSFPPEQLAEIARWLAWLGFAAWAARPLALRLLPGTGDGGWITGLALGWTIAGAVPWALAAAGVIGFSALGPAVAVAALAVTRGALPAPPRRGPGLPVLVGLGLSLFALGLFVRLQQPALATLEKPMDLGLVASAMRASAMPPPDVWFAGAPVNYYYVGHAMAGLWGLLAGVPADHAYQLTMASLFAMTGMLGAVLAQSLARPAGALLRGLAAALAAALLLLGGNLHVVLYTFFRDRFTTLEGPFFFPQSTRYIGFDPPTGDKAFTEFVAYAFKVGDLHAHVLATPLVLLGLLVLLAMFREGRAGRGPGWGRAVAYGGLLGLLAGVNSWDLATLGLSGLFVLTALSVRPGFGRLLAQALAALAVMAAVAALFMLRFDPIGQGIAAVSARTPLWQLGVIYGHGLLPLAVALWLALRGGAEARFTAQLALAAVVLVAIPEVIRVVDIYGTDHQRANTMFKLSFRAQMLLPVIACASFARLAAAGGWRWLPALLVAGSAALPLAYIPWTWPERVARNLDGGVHLGAEDRALVTALEGLPFGPGAFFLEAAGDSYGPTGRLSAQSGRPAAMGWQVHEWLWRSDKEGAAARRAEVAAAYAGDAAALCRLKAMGLRYVVLGKLERETYPALAEARLAALGPAMAEAGASRIVRLDRCAP